VARLSAKAYPWKGVNYWRLDGETVERYKARVKREEQEDDIAWEELIEKTVALPDGEILGALVTYPVADGFAAYVVIQEEPLTLQWIPFGDMYQADHRLIKGTDRRDVLTDISARKMLHKVFNKKEEA